VSQKEILKSAILEMAMPLSPISTDVEPATVPISGIKAVIFDIYGTLLISGSGDVGTIESVGAIGAVQRAFEYAHIPISSGTAASEAVSLFKQTILDDHSKGKNAGIEFPEIEVRSVWARVFDKLRSLNLIESIPDSNTIELFSVVYEIAINPGWLMPNYHPLLAGLKDTGVVLGIVSNAQFFTPLVLEALSGKTLESNGFNLECVVMSYQLLEAKPSQRLFSILAEGLKSRFGIEPAGALYVGNDMKNDMLPAGASSFKTALFAGDRRSYRPRKSDPSCGNVTPDCVVTDLLQIPEIVSPRS
jgi:putative hydrolase of the HAD superfamily